MMRYIMVPIVGAIIGYATNWIAVKMLFRPHYEIRVFGFKLPFTPGVIPKGQKRMAKAVGRAVEDQLLTMDVLKAVLLSDDMKDKVRDSVKQWMEKEEASEKTLKDLADGLLSQEKEEEVVRSLKNHVTEVLYFKLVGMNVGNLVAEKVLEAAKEKLAESMLGMMIGGSMLDPIAEMIENRINEYIADFGEEYIAGIVDDETDHILGRTMGQGLELVRQHDVDLPEILVSLYGDVIEKELPKALSLLNLSAIVEDRINAMEVAEVEDLLLSIMKKELGAIVNLGALIGLVLGLVNVAILLI
ncbi:MAG: DUF445 family protein [Eubacterium sp.]|nr:DUF445 family protein [Eubacterium sp.]